jgi:hypothetical protein
MKKQITITEMSLVTRTIEVEVPSYYTKFTMYIAITDESVIKVYDDGKFSLITPATQEKRYNEEVVDALKYNPAPISKELFEEKLQNSIKCLTEQYQLSMNMLDPNAIAPQQAEGQEVKAAEAEQTEQATEETGEAVAVE